MKPANFPSRVLIRQARAAARALGQPEPEAPPHVTDMRWRIGADKRREHEIEATHMRLTREHIAQQYTQTIKGRINESATLITHASRSNELSTHDSNNVCPHRATCMHGEHHQHREWQPMIGRMAEPTKP
jgi:hypothetical protein